MAVEIFATIFFIVASVALIADTVYWYYHPEPTEKEKAEQQKKLKAQSEKEYKKFLNKVEKNRAKMEEEDYGDNHQP